MTTLDLVIPTHRQEGIARVAAMDLPHVEGVRYIVSWQNHDDGPVPPALERDDMEVHRLDKSGVSQNRNNAMDHCKADVIYFADDDIVITEHQLRQIAKTFEDNASLDLASFMVDIPSGPLYPPAECRLTFPFPKDFWVMSIAIACRRAAIGDLRFHPDLGLGAPVLNGGEDEFFLLAAIRRGLNCRFIPVEICTHPSESTGTKPEQTAGNLRASGCYIAIAYPRSWPLRLVAKSLRLSRSGRGALLRSLYFLFAGACHAPSILDCDKRYRW